MAATVTEVFGACAPRVSIGMGRVITRPFARDRWLLTLVPEAVDDADFGGAALVLSCSHQAAQCVLSTGYLMEFEAFEPAEIPHAEIEAIVVTREGIDTLMAGSRAIRALIFRAYSQQMSELLLRLGSHRDQSERRCRSPELKALLCDTKPFGRPA
ncbi:MULTISPECIES: hypothetical protein [Thalassobacter]|uniref:hypothetical protein n=1 Tax=Thalassobacter TaxID=266808 RepID=UPI00126A6E52|nr:MULTISPECIES: hypothetical protein [Thalassobacter]